MKQLYSAKDSLEAQSVRLYLDSLGINARVVGDNSPLEVGFAFTPASAPTVVVASEDIDRATAALQQYFERAEESDLSAIWRCLKCGEKNEDQFDACWKCETPRGDALVEPRRTSERDQRNHRPTLPTGSVFQPNLNRAVVSTARMWTEIAAVTVLGLLASLGPLASRASSLAGTAWIVRDVCLWGIALNLGVLLLIARFIQRDGDAWSTFGIKKPRIIWDSLSSVLVLFLFFCLLFSGLRVLAEVYDLTRFTELIRTRPPFLRPLTPYERTIVLVAALFAAVTEEIAMRGFVLTKLNKATKSWPIAVIVSSLLSLNYHAVYGFGAAIASFFIFLYFAIVMSYKRRIWPVVIAHAVIVWAVFARTS